MSVTINIHGALIALTSFMNSNWSVILCGVFIRKNNLALSSQFEGLERLIQNNAHGFELEALVRKVASQNPME